MNRYERKRRYLGSRGDVHSGIWLIGLAILFFTGFWWPGILILAGISMVVESVLADRARPEFPPVEQPSAPPAAAPVTPAPTPSPAPAASPVVFTPAARFHPVGALPATCPNCGGPVRAHEVQWTGSRSAVCAYCGSNLPLK